MKKIFNIFLLFIIFPKIVLAWGDSVLDKQVREIHAQAEEKIRQKKYKTQDEKFLKILNPEEKIIYTLCREDCKGAQNVGSPSFCRQQLLEYRIKKQICNLDTLVSNE